MFSFNVTKNGVKIPAKDKMARSIPNSSSVLFLKMVTNGNEFSCSNQYPISIVVRIHKRLMKYVHRFGVSTADPLTSLITNIIVWVHNASSLFVTEVPNFVEIQEVHK